MNKFALTVIYLTIGCLTITSNANAADGGVTSNEVYNPREEIEYSYRATLERQEEQNREKAFKQYQQKQYLEQERLMNRQNMYNQNHQKKASDW